MSELPCSILVHPYGSLIDAPATTDLDMSSEPILFESTFLITDSNQQKYDRVARFAGVHDDLKFSLDISVELYPCSVGETVHLAIAHTLALDGSKQDPPGSKSGWNSNVTPEPSLADPYDYVCYGKIYRFDEGNGETTKVYASFGGLLLFLEGPHKKLSSLKHEHIYLLMKK